MTNGKITIMGVLPLQPLSIFYSDSGIIGSEPKRLDVFLRGDTGELIGFDGKPVDPDINEAFMTVLEQNRAHAEQQAIAKMAREMNLKEAATDKGKIIIEQ